MFTHVTRITNTPITKAKLSSLQDRMHSFCFWSIFYACNMRRHFLTQIKITPLPFVIEWNIQYFATLISERTWPSQWVAFVTLYHRWILGAGDLSLDNLNGFDIYNLYHHLYIWSELCFMFILTLSDNQENVAIFTHYRPSGSTPPNDTILRIYFTHMNLICPSTWYKPI